ncbi:MerR family transcriptional regulator [Streptomyces sp. NPDC005322]|uniref:MerR family transcriptional regulator n=1 Tax=unclassified Streptomyces TaxID=2593676 RepID=UPI0033B510B4
MSVMEAGLRPIDLARMAGVSTQQIRNYVDTCVLPPATRTPAGYRRLDDRHRRALLAYQALLRGYGTETARAVMRAVHAGNLPEALTLVNAGHAALHEERLSLQATGEALEAVAEQTPHSPALPRSNLRIGEVAAHLGVRTSALRVWESAGLLAPRREPGTTYRTYSPTDVRDVRMISMLRQGRYPLSQIQPVLDGLRRTGSSDALREAIARRQEQLIQRATAMLEGSSRLHHYITDGTENRPAKEPGPQR